MTMLMLFVPWRSPKELNLAGTSWKDKFHATSFSQHQLRIMKNMNILFECMGMLYSDRMCGYPTWISETVVDECHYLCGGTIGFFLACHQQPTDMVISPFTCRSTCISRQSTEIIGGSISLPLFGHLHIHIGSLQCGHLSLHLA